MTKSCVVPRCKTGYKSDKEKRSVFHVPKNVEHLKKWEAANPGNVKLRVSYFVCDKHFKKQDILREWIKYDSNGQIIARVPYKHPQLSKNAIPTIFGEKTEEEAKAVATLREYLGSLNLESRVNASIESVGSSLLECSAPGRSIQDPEITNSLLVVSSDDITSTDIAGVDNAKMNVPMEVTESNSTTSSTNNKPYSVLSTITISDQIKRANESLSICEQYSIVIPSHWSVSEISGEKRPAYSVFICGNKKGK